MKSLESRLQLSVALSLALFVLIAWYLGQYALHRMMQSFILSRLQHDTEAIVAALRVDPPNLVSLGMDRLTPVYNQPLSGHYFVLQAPGIPPILSRSLWDDSLPVPHLSQGETRLEHRTGPGGQTLLVWAVAYEKKGVPFTLVVAEDVSPLETMLSRYKWLFALVSLVGLLIMLLIQHRVIHLGFQRLRPVLADMRRLERGDAVELTEDVPREIYPLVGKFNALLRIQQERLERSRNVAGNLAHALKTPLNLLLQTVDGPALSDREPARRGMTLEIERIQTLIDRELKKARMAGSGVPGQRFDPHSELPNLVNVLRRAHPDRTLDVLLEVPSGLTVNADREDMLELLGNLLDNAFKWARNRVSCSVEASPGGIEFRIEDDGPGCDEQDLAIILERGVRLDENRPGHGLGLAIAQDIAQLYGNGLRLDRSPTLHGLRAQFFLAA